METAAAIADLGSDSDSSLDSNALPLRQLSAAEFQIMRHRKTAIRIDLREHLQQFDIKD